MTGTDTANSSPYSGELTSSRFLPASNRSSVILFCIANFFWWMGLYLYVPVLPVYIQLSGAPLNMVGIVLAAYAIPQVLLRIPTGVWADRLLNRKPLVLVGMVFTSLGALGLGLATEPWLLFLARMVVGVGAALWVVFTIFFTSYYPAKDSGKAIGLINFVRGGALIAATAGGGFIAEAFSLRQAFFSAAILGVFAILAMVFARERTIAGPRTMSWRSFSSVSTHPLLIMVSIMGILMHFSAFAGVFGFVPVYAAEIGASSSELGLITMINLGFTTLGSLLAVWIWGKLGYRASVIWGAMLTCVSMFAIPFISGVPVLMAVQIVNGMGGGVLMTTLMTLSIRDVSQEHRATAMGVFQAVYAIGMLTGPLVSGLLGVELGLSAIFFFAAALVLVISLLAFLPVFYRYTVT